MEPLSPVEMIYMYLLDDFRKAHSGKLADVAEVDAVIRYVQKRWPDDVKRYRRASPRPIPQTNNRRAIRVRGAKDDKSAPAGGSVTCLQVVQLHRPVPMLKRGGPPMRIVERLVIRSGYIFQRRLLARIRKADRIIKAGSPRHARHRR